jgi:hypothetical protein
MSKKFIITEEEKNEIRLMYNISEQNSQLGQILTGLMDNVLSTDVNGNISTQEVSQKGQELLNNPIFKEKLKEISTAIGIDENSIIKLMNFESGLDPKNENSFGCVGLIQFCPPSRGGSTKTIKGKVYNLEELKNNLVLQMDAIKEFWLEGGSGIESPKDLYIYNILPAAVGKPDNYVLKTNNASPETLAKQNPAFNTELGRPIDTPLTVGDLVTFYRKRGMV